MSVDDALLLLRGLFLAALYLFLVVLALLLRRELRSRTLPSEERAPGDLMIVDPANSGLDPGERLPLLAHSTVGRGEGNDVVLPDTFVSAEHARLLWNGNGWVVEDLHSTNGTFVNGKGVSRVTTVRPGDELTFGHVKLKLVPL